MKSGAPKAVRIPALVRRMLSFAMGGAPVPLMRPSDNPIAGTPAKKRKGSAHWDRIRGESHHTRPFATIHMLARAVNKGYRYEPAPKGAPRKHVRVS